MCSPSCSPEKMYTPFSHPRRYPLSLEERSVETKTWKREFLVLIMIITLSKRTNENLHLGAFI
jgi:hypothetical protein